MRLIFSSNIFDEVRRNFHRRDEINKLDAIYISNGIHRQRIEVDKFFATFFCDLATIARDNILSI